MDEALTEWLFVAWYCACALSYSVLRCFWRNL